MGILTDTKLRALKPRPKLYRVADMGGLCIEIRPTGARCWRYRYRFAGKANMLDLGDYPAMSLQEARRERDRQRALLDAGTDPAAARRQARQREQVNPDECFEVLAKEWIEKQGDWSPATLSKAEAMLGTWAYPWIGKRPARAITAADMLEVLRRPERAGKIETAQRLKQRCGQIFRYGIPTGRCERDPTADLRGVLTRVAVKHHASITDRAGIGALLRAIQGYGGRFATVCALQLSALTFVRPGELRQWEWSEISEDGATWRLPGPKMKMGVPHLVPLCRQAQAIIAELRPLTGWGRYLFPGMRDPRNPMSEAAIGAALRGMGYDSDVMTAHGFRSMASTLLNEEGWNRDWIERQLAHADPTVRGDYNYAEFLPGRREMMQAWADLLDQLRDGAKVIPIKSSCR